MSSTNLIRLEGLIKSVVKEHTRKTRSGKVSQVRQHEDKRTKKTVEGKSKGMSSGLSSIVKEVAKHDDFESAYTAFKHRTGIPREVADEFFQKFGEKGALDPEEAFKNLYDYAKGDSGKSKPGKTSATAKKKGKAKEDPKKKSGKKSAAVGENGYKKWYDSEGEAEQDMVSMKKEGFDPAYVAEAYHRESGGTKFKIYRSREELAKVNAAYHAKEAVKQVAKKKEEDAKLDVDGFGADLKPMNRTRAVTALNKQIKANGKLTTLKDLVRESVKAGKKPSIEEVAAIKPMSRTRFNRSSNREQELHEKKMKESGKKKVYYVGDYDLGKTAYDYAVHLRNKKLKKSLPSSLLLIKSRVKDHTRKLKSGKAVQVQEHEDKRTKGSKVRLKASVGTGKTGHYVESFAMTKGWQEKLRAWVAKHGKIGDVVKIHQSDKSGMVFDSKPDKTFKVTDKNLRKSQVKAHTRHLQSGKMVNVKEHTDSRKKKTTPKKKVAHEYRGHAEEIKRQIGSGAMFMIGAKNVAKGHNEDGAEYLSFKIGRNSKGVTYVKVTLNANDEYDVEFGKVGRGSRANPGPTYKVVNNVDGIQVDQLHETIEQNTGLYLSMGNMRKSRVSSHTRRMKSGKTVQVREHADSRTKKAPKMNMDAVRSAITSSKNYDGLTGIRLGDLRAEFHAAADEIWGMAQNKEYGLVLESYSNVAGSYKRLKVKDKASGSKDKSFEVGGLAFTAVKYTHPIPHWRLKVPSGEVWNDGAGGISNVSIPKMKADLEYALSRFGKERFVKEFS